jgi:hypothetical protein
MSKFEKVSAFRLAQGALSAEKQGNAAGPSVHSGRVVNFIDAETQAVRRDAVRRLRSAGIFKIPGPKASDK